MNIKVWKTHVQQIIEGAKVSLATEMKKDDVYVIGRKPKKRGFVSTIETKDNFSVYMNDLIRDLKNQGKHEIAESDRRMDEDTAKLDEAIDSLIKQTSGLADKYTRLSDTDISPSVLREQKLLDLGLTFLEAGSYGDVPFGEAYLAAGLPINFQHPVNKKTALHEACAHAAEPAGFVNLLLEDSNCDLLIPDKQGRLPYEMIYCFGHDVDLADKIKQKTLEQAAKKGVTVNFDFEVKIAPAPD